MHDWDYFLGIESAKGGILFLPEGLSAGDWTIASDSYSWYKGVYYNGVKLGDDDNIIKAKNTSEIVTKGYAPGFYNYIIDGDGYVTKLEAIDADDWGQLTAGNLIDKADNLHVLGFGVLNDGEGYVLADDVVVKDVRPDENEEYDGINAVVEFFDDNADESAPLSIVYVLNSSDKVQTIYVVDKDDVDWDVTAKSTITDPVYTLKVNGEESDTVDAYHATVTVNVSREKAFNNPYIKVTYNTDGETPQYAYVQVNAGTDKSFEFEVEVDGETTITVTAINGQPTPWE